MSVFADKFRRKGKKVKKSKYLSIIVATLLCSHVAYASDVCNATEMIVSTSSHSGGSDNDNDKDDVSVQSFYLSLTSGNYNQHKITKTLEPGQSFVIYGEGKVKNESSHKLKDVDIDFRMDYGKNFDKGDTKLDEDQPDIGAGKTVTKHTGSISVKLLSNAKQIVVTGKSGNSERFDVDNNKATFYIFVDAKGGDDRYISSSDKKKEYGKVVVTVKIPAPEEIPANSNGAKTVMRFYNSNFKAHYFNTNWNAFVGSQYGNWDKAGSTTFNAFETQKQGTVPLYFCWTGSTHDYDIDINKVGDHASCTEDKQILFYVYPNKGNTEEEKLSRSPVYLMYNSSVDSYILANGYDDKANLMTNHGFSDLGGPLFWTPKYKTVQSNSDDSYAQSSCGKKGFTIEKCIEIIDSVFK